MRYPPVKIIQAVQQGRIDYRVKRAVTHFRHFFRVTDANGQETSEPHEIARIEMTPRAKDYCAQIRAAQPGFSVGEMMPAGAPSAPP